MQKTLVWYVTKKELIEYSAVCRAIGILFFLMLTAGGAFVYIPLPFTPVPLTLQTFFVLWGAAFLRRSDAVISQSLYLGLGALGMPFFSAGQGGLWKLFGPTGGYLIGFIFASFIVSSLLENHEQKSGYNFFPLVTAMACGLSVIYFLGGLWLFLFMHFTLLNVFMLGILPFIAGDMLKIIAAAALYKCANLRIRHIFK